MKTADPSQVEQSYSFRTATHPFWVTPKEMDFFNQLGRPLAAFYRAANQIYLDSLQGAAPSWIAEYLNQGKPPSIIAYGKESGTRHPLPGIIRPDLILTHPDEGVEGMIATELDAVPGGIGLTWELAQPYDANIIGGQDGMRQGFDQMIRSVIAGKGGASSANPSLAIVVSDESASYRPEMEVLGTALSQAGLTTFVVAPEAVLFSDEGVYLESEKGHSPISIIYRFFELFDLPNVPESDRMFHAAQNGQVALTPPPAAHLEEKMLFALFHHPDLKPYWVNTMGEETTSFLANLFPKTWILDPRKNRQSSVALHDLIVQGRAVSNFDELGRLTQKERRLVIKPSGFSAQAWGSRGVCIGHDLPEVEWNNRLQTALAEFHTTPWVLQPFHKGRRVKMEYLDDKVNLPVKMEGRVRLSPYYFIVDNDNVFLGGVLATVCPLNKKLIHGMSEAVMAPCAVGKRDDDII